MATYKNAAGFSPEKIELLEVDLAGLDSDVRVEVEVIRQRH